MGTPNLGPIPNTHRLGSIAIPHHGAGDFQKLWERLLLENGPAFLHANFKLYNLEPQHPYMKTYVIIPALADRREGG